MIDKIIDILIKKFIKDYKNIEDKNVRIQYGIFSSIVGIISYIIIFIIKIVIGCFLSSIAVIADALHNLVDLGSSLAALIGFKMSKKPADSEHPFGHGRIEYISALVVAIIIFLVGYEFFKISINKIFHPNNINFSIVSIVIFILTILINIWQYLFYKKIGKKINSKVLIASSKENLNDILTTLGAALSLIFYYYLDINIDGYIGILISLLIIHSSYSIGKETLSTLIGETATEEYVKKIKDKLLSYEGILGVHDIIVHNYGPSNSMVILHAEVSNKNSIDKAHNLIDKIEKDIKKELGIFLVIHMDPVNVNDHRIEEISKVLENYKKDLKIYIDAHDIRIIDLKDSTKIVFDLELPHNIKTKDKNIIIKDINKLIKSINENYKTEIEIEHGYVKRN